MSGPRSRSRTAADIPRQRCSCPPLTAANSRRPFRRRVSFRDAVVDQDCRTIMQNDPTRRDNGDRTDNVYDIWQADDSEAGRSDDGCEGTPRSDVYSENCASGCTFGRVSLENVHESVARDGPTDRVAEDRTMSSEDVSNSSDYKDVDSVADEYRMRGGCCGGTPRESVRRSSQDHGCCCCGREVEPNESCAAEPTARCDGGVKATCTPGARRCSCRYVQGCRRAVCKKAVTRCGEIVPACTTGARSCGGGGCCGGGCRGVCGKPGQICTPSSRSCSSPARGRPRSSRGRSPCTRPRCPTSCPLPADCATTSGCSAGCVSCHRCGGGGGYECGSSRCRSTLNNGCCVNDRTKCGADEACCRLKLPVSCECFGGGLDCRRCGRKVYQAEMQIVSGAPYHNICFSCFCCRKPLEPLTYQENCGEIYCKQCYMRNFGPQGYGYGAGAGVLQTPL